MLVIQNNTLLIAFLPQDPVPHVQFNLCHINSTAFSLDWPTDICCISVPVYLCMLMLLFYYLSEEKKKKLCIKHSEQNHLAVHAEEEPR